MNLHLYQYGDCAELSGLSIGVARQTPRGIRVEDRYRKGYFQVWMPLLAPSKELYKAYLAEELTYQQFAQRYRSEMKGTEQKHCIELLAAVSQTTRINLGCFCENSEECHRSQLAKLIQAAAKKLPAPGKKAAKYFSSPCSMPEIED
ncbi:DUF488 family protein [Pelagicoccus sp. SDUM812005]|uniref:DUF488 domain-containing protein n=1 Tax=Pelagicoccus sp. SDUM812005 TaxID=3041257 RepID=UPI00281072D2|nr:DUF488 family protein [Pelagicoccus sp. SDUM812005]MDQ8182239.1 DUF488 family protein [Pelagicoccus sp. SDUM812005]